MEQKRFIPHAKPLPEKARKVRGGLKLTGEWPMRLSWAAAAWVEGVSKVAASDALAQGVEYARGAQTRTFTIELGRVVAEVQGRQYRPHQAVLKFATLSDTQWHAVESAMTEQAVFAAKLLAHEVPDTIQTVFDPLGLRLYPALGVAGSEEDLKVSCTCGHTTPWCKHVVCAALLLAERMDKNPFLVFTLRGLPGDELLERLRSRRAAAQGGDMFAQSLSQRLTAMGPVPSPALRDAADFPDEEGATPAPASTAAAPLEACLPNFWDMGPGLDALETPLKAPEVSHALLRRLGPSPFKEGKFPLVGLLATCYETISKSAIVGVDPGETDQPA
jgi:uncharacterized Zn finger protein